MLTKYTVCRKVQDGILKKNIEKLSEYHNKDVNIGKDHRM